jgi:class 3 adenylate cyclase
MLCELVDSTALSAQLNPKDMRDVNRVASEISRLDDHLAKLMGDGVVVYFVCPGAYEDEAERAVRA